MASKKKVVVKPVKMVRGNGRRKGNSLMAVPTGEATGLVRSGSPKTVFASPTVAPVTALKPSTALTTVPVAPKAVTPTPAVILPGNTGAATSGSLGNAQVKPPVLPVSPVLTASPTVSPAPAVANSQTANNSQVQPVSVPATTQTNTTGQDMTVQQITANLQQQCAAGNQAACQQLQAMGISSSTASLTQPASADVSGQGGAGGTATTAPVNVTVNPDGTTTTTATFNPLWILAALAALFVIMFLMKKS